MEYRSGGTGTKTEWFLKTITLGMKASEEEIDDTQQGTFPSMYSGLQLPQRSDTSLALVCLPLG